MFGPSFFEGARGFQALSKEKDSHISALEEELVNVRGLLKGEGSLAAELRQQLVSVTSQKTKVEAQVYELQQRVEQAEAQVHRQGSAPHRATNNGYYCCKCLVGRRSPSPSSKRNPHPLP